MIPFARETDNSLFQPDQPAQWTVQISNPLRQDIREPVPTRNTVCFSVPSSNRLSLLIIIHCSFPAEKFKNSVPWFNSSPALSPMRLPIPDAMCHAEVFTRNDTKQARS